MDRFTLAIVVGVVLLVAAGIGAATVVGRNAAPPDLSTPAGVALAYALAEQRGDAQAAWGLLASSTQARADRDRFLAHAGSYQHGDEYLSTEEKRIDGDEATVVLVRTQPRSGIFAGSGSSYRQTFRLAREPAGWRVTVPPDDYLLNLPAGGKP